MTYHSMSGNGAKPATKSAGGSMAGDDDKPRVPDPRTGVLGKEIRGVGRIFPQGTGVTERQADHTIARHPKDNLGPAEPTYKPADGLVDVIIHQKNAGSRGTHDVPHVVKEDDVIWRKAGS